MNQNLGATNFVSGVGLQKRAELERSRVRPCAVAGEHESLARCKLRPVVASRGRTADGRQRFKPVTRRLARSRCSRRLGRHFATSSRVSAKREPCRCHLRRWLYALVCLAHLHLAASRRRHKCRCFAAPMSETVLRARCLTGGLCPFARRVTVLFLRPVFRARRPNGDETCLLISGRSRAEPGRGFATC